MAFLTNLYPSNWHEISRRIKEKNNWTCERCKRKHLSDIGSVLTVHHIDMDKSNNEEWNLGALCQMCHLKVEGKNLFKIRDERGEQLSFNFLPIEKWFNPHYEGYLKNKQRKEKNIP